MAGAHHTPRYLILCVNQANEYLDTATGECAACDFTACPDDAFRAGACRGATNGFYCVVLGAKPTSERVPRAAEQPMTP